MDRITEEGPVDHSTQPEDNLERFLNTIQRSNADPIRNEDRQLKRVSYLGKSFKRSQNPTKIEKLSKLSSLQRTLKDREQELEAIANLLSGDLSPSSLEQFRKDQAGVIGEINR